MRLKRFLKKLERPDDETSRKLADLLLKDLVAMTNLSEYVCSEEIGDNGVRHMVAVEKVLTTLQEQIMICNEFMHKSTLHRNVVDLPEPLKCEQLIVKQHQSPDSSSDDTDHFSVESGFYDLQSKLDTILGHISNSTNLSPISNEADLDKDGWSVLPINRIYNSGVGPLYMQFLLWPKFNPGFVNPGFLSTRP